MLRFDKATYLSFLFKCALSEKLNISLKFYYYNTINYSIRHDVNKDRL